MPAQASMGYLGPVLHLLPDLTPIVNPPWEEIEAASELTALLAGL